MTATPVRRPHKSPAFREFRHRAGHPDFGAIAQLGEHLLCKQGVVGSIPTGSTRFADPSAKPAHSCVDCPRELQEPKDFGSVAQVVRAHP
jgi:hypothetical protein